MFAFEKREHLPPEQGEEWEVYETGFAGSFEGERLYYGDIWWNASLEELVFSPTEPLSEPIMLGLSLLEELARFIRQKNEESVRTQEEKSHTKKPGKERA